jgi:hypothetical protein
MGKYKNGSFMLNSNMRTHEKLYQKYEKGAILDIFI